MISKINLFILKSLFLSMFLTGSFIAAPLAAEAAPAYQRTLKMAADWRPAPGDLFMAFRSNAPHFWSWLKQQKSDLLQPVGLIIGDGHILNFRDTLLENGQREFTVVDVDDSGVGSLAGDFLRFYVGTQVSPYHVNGAKLIATYVDGLTGKKIDKPSFVKDTEDKDVSKDDIQKWVKKYIDHDKFGDKAAVAPISNTSSPVQALFRKWEPTFKEKLGPVDILDQGYKVHEEGGSQDLARFWFLVKEKNDFHIVEFKQEDTPAPAAFGPQPPVREDMLIDFSAIYRPRKAVMGIFEFISQGNETFLARERLPAELDFDPTKLDNKKTEQGQELSLYIAGRLGGYQSTQIGGEKLGSTLQSNPAAIKSLTDLADAYIEVMKQENK